MMANFLIIGFIGIMAYWWGAQGVFSSLLHLLCVIVAGTLAFALWEPITVNLLLPRLGGSAWGVGLLLPFALILLTIRVTLDRLIKANMYFAPLVNFTVGGFLGVLSAILTAGVTMIGLGFLDIGSSVGGYQRWVVDERGNVVDNPHQSLWVPVDAQAAGFFSQLSVGAFHSNEPLKRVRPRVDHMASIYRMHPDTNALIGAVDGGVVVDAWYRVDAPLTDAVGDEVARTMGSAARAAGNQLVIVETTWSQNESKAYDDDGTLRIAPTQIRLLALPEDGSNADDVLFAPIGVSRGGQEQRYYLPLNDPRFFAHGTGQRVTFAWAFLLPQDREPESVFARNLRLPLTSEPESEPDAVRVALGTLEPEVIAAEIAAQQSPDGTIEERDGIRTGSAGVAIELTDALPDQISRNMATSLRLEDNAIRGGSADVRRPEGGLSRALRVDRIAAPSHRGMVRVKLERDAALSWLGATRDAAARLQAIVLEDDKGNSWQPIAYVWHKAGGDQQISVDFSTPIRSGSQLPIAEMGQKDSLYLYFLVDRDSVITSYNVGSTKQEVKLNVPR